MTTNSARFVLTAALLLTGLSAPAFAHSGGGGHGGGGHGGGGHSGGSMGHGSASHAGGFSGHSVGFAGRAGSFAGYAGGAHVAMQHYASGGAGVHPGSFADARAPVAARSAAAVGGGRGAVASTGLRGRGFGPGVGRNGVGRNYARWGGGYWGGRFWPGAYYGPGFAWFLPLLPLYYSTFWWQGVPYYYYNDIYYTWSPTADGYVATDPPPAAAGSAPSPNDGSYYDEGAAANADAAPAMAASAPQPIPPGAFASGNGGDHVYAYPANGQSEDQQSSDRMQCDQWAASQAASAGSPDYRRAVIACFQGRGYSAQ
ncbi:MAG TPA: hypothetical protein VN757_11005 [Steroidobacteraceae bacterium]|nr:hypothetical protein [Steroidobacteraceae bacterium]